MLNKQTNKWNKIERKKDGAKSNTAHYVCALLKVIELGNIQIDQECNGFCVLQITNKHTYCLEMASR